MNSESQTSQAESDGRFRLDRQRLIENCHVDVVQYKDVVESTNDWALNSVDSFGRDHTVLFLATRQTAGRGRGNNRWLSGGGSLTFSLLIHAEFGIGDSDRNLIPLAAGCGVCDALAHHQVDAKIKWPNDILLRNKKLGGILVETARSGSMIVIGCGLNINNDLCEVPQAIGLKMAFARPFDITEMAIQAVNGILGRVKSIATDKQRLLTDLNSKDWLFGKQVEWTHATIIRTGFAAGICANGGLRLRNDEGEEIIHSGSIQPLPSPDNNESRKN